MKRLLVTSLTALLAWPVAAHAQTSGADALMNAVQANTPTAPGAAPVGAAPVMDFGGDLRPTNPLELQLFSEWRGERGVPYEVNAWVMKILRQQYSEAAHQWTVIEPNLPESFRMTARIAQDYLYWKLALPQTFFDEWVTRLADPAYMTSRMSAALEQTVSPGFDAWLSGNVPTVTAEQATRLRQLDASRSPMHLTALAYVLGRSGEAAMPVLNQLPSGHRFKPALARTVALALARKGDLAGAGRVLKTQLEPEIERLKDPHALAAHYLEVARLLYQAGALEASENYYQRVPNSVPQYLYAREELTWIWLRTGDSQKLRGSLETLGSKIFSDRFGPEVNLVRAISNLKLCYYNEVERDFARFQSTSRPWANRIAKALAENDPPASPMLDENARQAATALQSRETELKNINALAEKSVGASLPAVGPQLHWKQARDRIIARIEEARKVRSNENRRQWKDLRLALTEAIRKMQFVKVELLSQTQLAGYEAPSSDAIRVSSAAPQREVSSASVHKTKEEIGFVFDGVIWPDELFRLRALAPGRCAGQAPEGAQP